MERRPDILLSDIECALKPLIEECGGTLDVVSDLDEALELAGKSPNSWRVILNWEGYGSHPDSISGMTYVKFITIVQANVGLTINPKSRVYKQSIGGKPSFIALLEQVSKWMRALRWPDGAQVDCRGLALEDSQWVAGSPAKTTAKALTWQLAMALPHFTEHICIPLNPTT